MPYLNVLQHCIKVRQVGGQNARVQDVKTDQNVTEQA